MRSIAKTTEPSILGDLRRRGESWDGGVQGDEKAELRAALHAEQRALCAYCMSRISLERGSNSFTRIEHWAPRSSAPERTYEWSNLLGVCGGLGLGNEPQCDVSKGARAITAHPARDRQLERRFQYTARGEIRAERTLSKSERSDLESDITILNLNSKALKSNRRRVLQELRDTLRHARRTSQAITRLVHRYSDQGGPLEEYIEVARQYLDKKVRQAARA